MIIFPAIDIKGGKCVRLLKGDFENLTEYKNSPFDQANIFSKIGFKNLHLVDLDGALEGKLINKNSIQSITKINGVKIQVGGGVRSLEQIDELIKLGVDKVILGTKAIEDPSFLKKACIKFDKKIVLAIDVRNGFLSLSGWKRQTDILATDFIKKVNDFNISRIIYTDIDRDGTKSGPNIDSTVAFSKSSKFPIVVSGGISSIEDVKSLKSENAKEIEGVIIGKAIYDQNININELAKII